jgi:predicted kinase
MIPSAAAAVGGAPPYLVIVGGFAGTGKTAVSRRLAVEFCVPRLGSDTIGRTIAGSEGLQGRDVDSYWIAYDVLFRLCAEFIAAGVSTILDVTMGWEFQWRAVDAILGRHTSTSFVPVVLRCPRPTCIEQIRRRHAARPDHYDPPEVYTREPKLLAVWDYLAKLDRPELRYVDASGTLDDVYAKVRGCVLDGSMPHNSSRLSVAPMPPICTA